MPSSAHPANLKTPAEEEWVVELTFPGRLPESVRERVFESVAETVVLLEEEFNRDPAKDWDIFMWSTRRASL